MEVSCWENHLFLWAIYTMAMLNNQSVYFVICMCMSHLHCTYILWASLSLTSHDQTYSGISTWFQTTCNIYKNNLFFRKLPCIEHSYHSYPYLPQYPNRTTFYLARWVHASNAEHHIMIHFINNESSKSMQ